MIDFCPNVIDDVPVDFGGYVGEWRKMVNEWMAERTVKTMVK